MKKKIAPDSVKKVAGGANRWTEVEEQYLMELLLSAEFYTSGCEGYNWTRVANELNRVFGNKRTPASCESRTSKLRNDGTFTDC